MTNRISSALGLALAFVLGCLAMTSGARAQDGTPAATGFDLVSPTATIHAGSCGAIEADPAFSLGELQRLGVSGFVGVPGGENVDPENTFIDVGPTAIGTPGVDQGGIADQALPAPTDVEGALAPYVIAGGFAVDTTLDALLGSPHALVVQGDTGEAAGVRVACAEIVGLVENERLTLALRPVDRSGYFGYAVLEEDEPGTVVFGGEATGVSIYLFYDLPTLRERGTTATPAA